MNSSMPWLLQLVALVSTFFLSGMSVANAAEGMEGQSPVAISSNNTYFGRLSPLQFNFSSDTGLSVINTGSPSMEATVQANVSSGARSLTLNGDIYELEQFHFSTPAEHSLNGQKSPMEMHLVFMDSADRPFVVGRWINEGAFNSALDPIFSNLPQTTTDSVAISSFDLNALLPDNLASFRYTGSLPGTSFTEGVEWAMLAQPMEMSGAQIQAFQTLFPMGNAHPIQPLNERVILTDVPGFVSAIPEPETYAMFLAGLGLISFVANRGSK